jgi:hypothetical protein
VLSRGVRARELFRRKDFSKKSKVIVNKEIKAEIGEIIFFSYFLAKRIKNQGNRN